MHVIFVLSDNLFILILRVPLSACMCTICMMNGRGGQKRASNPLETEIREATSHHVDTERWKRTTWGLGVQTHEPMQWFFIFKPQEEAFWQSDLIVDGRRTRILVSVFGVGRNTYSDSCHEHTWLRKTENKGLWFECEMHPRGSGVWMLAVQLVRSLFPRCWYHGTVSHVFSLHIGLYPPRTEAALDGCLSQHC